jgi:hypothetical protein
MQQNPTVHVAIHTLEKTKMRGGAIFLSFFIFFTMATLAVPIPMFPGNLVQLALKLAEIPFPPNPPLLEAVVNGLFYGFIVWIVFVLVSQRLEEPDIVVKPKEKKNHSRKQNVTRRG